MWPGCAMGMPCMRMWVPCCCLSMIGYHVCLHAHAGSCPCDECAPTCPGGRWLCVCAESMFLRDDGISGKCSVWAVGGDSLRAASQKPPDHRQMQGHGRQWGGLGCRNCPSCLSFPFKGVSTSRYGRSLPNKGAALSASPGCTGTVLAPTLGRPSLWIDGHGISRWAGLGGL